MWNKYSYKTKGYLILFAAIFGLVVLYFFSFKNTIDLIATNYSLKDKIEKASKSGDEIRYFQAKLKVLESRLQNYVIDSVKNREYILHLTSDFCDRNSLILKDFPLMEVDKQEGYEIETNQIVAEGDFINLLKLLYEIEKVTLVGRPASVSFKKKMDHKRRKEVLDLNIYLQNFRKNESGL